MSICIPYQYRKCYYGSKCQNLHLFQYDICDILCKYIHFSECKYGNECQYFHHKPEIEPYKVVEIVYPFQDYFTSHLLTYDLFNLCEFEVNKSTFTRFDKVWNKFSIKNKVIINERLNQMKLCIERNLPIPKAPSIYVD